MPDYDENMPILHVYSPVGYHDRTFISGSRAGLEVLKAAIERALAGEKPGKDVPVYFCNNGEGGDLVVEAFDQATAERLYLPYVDETCNVGQDEDAVKPWEAWGERIKR